MRDSGEYLLNDETMGNDRSVGNGRLCRIAITGTYNLNDIQWGEGDERELESINNGK